MQPEYLSENSVATFFDTSTTTVRRWVASGALPPPSMIGGSKRWHVDALRAAAGKALDAANSNGHRLSDPDEIMRRKIADAEKARHKKAR